MCIVFYTLSQPGYKLILAANRDEFLDRPATHAAWHNFDAPKDDTWVLCGRDLGSPDKGTWLGITRDLRVGILTNIRYPLTPPPPNAPSRGRLLKAFLAPPPAEAASVERYASTIDPDSYVGFNLLLFKLNKRSSGWNETDVGYISNRPKATVSQPRGDGCHGMSNSPWTEPYPKVVEGEKDMAGALSEWAQAEGDDDDLVERMMKVLSPAPDIHGVEDMTRATRVTPFLIGGNVESSNHPSGQKRWYGTRVSTVILVKDDGQVVFVERDIHILQDGQAVAGSNERRERFHA